jgi:hypothetical protein
MRETWEGESIVLVALSLSFLRLKLTRHDYSRSQEVGLDLAERDWISVGQLDDREITSSLGKRLLMILSPFGKQFLCFISMKPSSHFPFHAVFLHTSPHAAIPELQETEVASAHWIPLELLHAPTARYGSVDIDIASRLAPKNKVARAALKMLVGQMSFK